MMGIREDGEMMGAFIFALTFFNIVLLQLLLEVYSIKFLHHEQ